MNVLHLKQRVNLGVSQEAYSDDSYDLIPFTCDCRLDKDELWGRLSHAIYKRFPPSPSWRLWILLQYPKSAAGLPR